MMGYGFGGPFAWWGMGLGMVIHLAFAALVILAVIWLFKAVFRDGCRSERRVDALEILKARYARGEITSEEFQRIKKELE